MNIAALTVIGLVIGVAALSGWALYRRPHGPLWIRHTIWADRARLRQRALWQPDDDRRPYAVEFREQR